MKNHMIVFIIDYMIYLKNIKFINLNFIIYNLLYKINLIIYNIALYIIMEQQ